MTPKLPLDDFLPYRLNRLAEAVARDFGRVYRERYGMTRPEWRLLATLGATAAMTATEIGRHSSMHKTKVSRAVAGLEKRGWVRRRRDRQDRRIEHLELTSAGIAAYKHLVPLAQAYQRDLLQAMGEDGSRAAIEGLRALEAACALR
jgi:DNA-binding MarR family transcriptional regulator